MNDLKSKLAKVIERFKEEVNSLRTGRATPALVENLEVDYYGTKTPLKALAVISNPEARQLVIQPWDKNAVQPIEKAIQASPLGINPVTDKDAIRLMIPALTEERRKDLVKTLGKFTENARIHIRREREEALQNIERQAKAKQISEDEKFRHKNDIQRQVDEFNRQVEETTKAKEKEIMTI